nr:uncharacterized mitochondrial protein AtMg00810-like [Tanacetum cinerariifolium]
MHISQQSGFGTDEGTGSRPGVPDVPSDNSEEKLSWNSSDDEDVDEQSKGIEESEGDKTDESDDDNDEEETTKIGEQKVAESDEGDDEATENGVMVDWGEGIVVTVVEPVVKSDSKPGLVTGFNSCNKQALETELTQLKDTKIAAQKAEIATLSAKTVGNKTSRTTKPENPKETLKLSPRFTKKLVAPLLKKPNVNVPLSTGIKSATGASKPTSKSNAWIYRKLPAKSAKKEKVKEHIRNLNKNNHVDSHVKRSVSVKNINVVYGACHECLISSNHDNCLVYSVKSMNRKQPKAKNTVRTTKKVWRPKVVTSVKPMWKPTGQHFTLYDSYPLTRILEPTVEPIKLSSSVSSSTKIPMLSMFVAVTLGMESWFQRNPCYYRFAHEMSSTFQMSMMGQMSFFLGLKVLQNPRGIFINQSKYALEILKKYDFDSSTPIDTPMVERPKLDEDKGGKLIDHIRYRGMVGSLMYLSASRPDIVFAGTLKGKWRYLIPAITPIHNHVLIPNYQDFKIQDFRYSDRFECFQAINIGRVSSVRYSKIGIIQVLASSSTTTSISTLLIDFFFTSSTNTYLLKYRIMSASFATYVSFTWLATNRESTFV